MQAETFLHKIPKHFTSLSVYIAREQVAVAAPCISELMAPELGGGCTSEPQSAVADLASPSGGLNRIPCAGAQIFPWAGGSSGRGAVPELGGLIAGEVEEQGVGFFKALQKDGEEE